MATLEQLPADRRAIIELVLRRGQSYADLAQVLDMPEARVRRYAREALASLAPDAADRVESEWLGQIADYLLRQQEGPQAKATRAHIRRSEPARAWALAMLDTLGGLYPAGAEPAIPGADGASERPARETERAADGGNGAGAATRPRRERARGEGRDPTAARERRQRRAEDGRDTEAASDRGLSPEAQAVVRRRRLIGAAIGAVVAVAAVVGILAIVGVFGGGEDEAASGDAPAAGAEDSALRQPPEVLAQIELEPVEGGSGRGGAILAEQEGQALVVVQAKVPPTDDDEAYGVWLYNSEDDAVSLGAQITDNQGNLQGAGPLPQDFEQYRFVDISLQERDGGAEHSGNSVLRGEIQGLESGAGDSGAQEQQPDQ